jgi:uncharacterized protein
MKWTPGGSSEDIEDRRDEGGGGGGGMQLGGMHVGLGGILVLGLLSLVFKRDLVSPFLGGSDPSTVASAPDPARTQAEKPLTDFVTFVFNDVQQSWEKVLPNYRHAKLVLFREQTQSGCGTAEEASGPFYCPADEKVYIDLGFYDELRTRFGAAGQFAQAYVLAHELGHHVQKLTGIEGKVRQLQESNPSEANPLSVRMELQADCLAGVWAKTTQQRGLLEPGDVESGLTAAASVGDDHIQKMAGRRVSPETFTHGSSADRVKWVQTGMQGGTIQSCNTFQ